MELDWLTVSAQVVNFLILVWLLKRFLYQPVVGAMAEREHLIASQLEAACQREQAAREEQLAYKKRRSVLIKKQQTILEKAHRQGKEQRQQLLEQARAEIARLVKQWRQELEEEQANYLLRLREEGARAIMQATGRILADLADTALETKIIDRFVKNLETLPQEELRQLVKDRTSLDVTTTFPLGNEQQCHLVQSLKPFTGDRTLVFHQSDRPRCGIEVTGEGVKLDWNIARYLDELEQQMLDLLQDQQSRVLMQSKGNPDA